MGLLRLCPWVLCWGPEKPSAGNIGVGKTVEGIGFSAKVGVAVLESGFVHMGLCILRPPAMNLEVALHD